MSSGLPATVKFSVDWKVPWIEVGWRSTEKTFVTSNNNVSLRWRAVLWENHEFDPTTESLSNRPTYGFFLYYEDGPLENFDGMNYTVAIVQPDQTTSYESTKENYGAIRSEGRGWESFEDSVSDAIIQLYLTKYDVVTYRIVLKIPASVFSYKIENPLPTTTPLQWLLNLFKVIDDPKKSVHSDAKLISHDGHSFYCHKVMISFQSAALGAMFSHPPAEGQAENEYPFPLDKDSLKPLIEYLYTGHVTFGSLLSADVIALAYSAEQYDLKPLKLACAAVLWDRVVKEPFICYYVVRFADGLDHMKYLKYRAMDVLVEKSDMVDSSTFDEGDEGKKLLHEFFLFACRRVTRSE